jgi:hypothetical protein
VKLKLMPDYGCFPLWWVDHPQGLVGDVDPETLPLTPATRARLLAWAKSYDESLDWDDPAATKPLPRAELDAFKREGLALLKKLREELTGYEVVSDRPE